MAQQARNLVMEMGERADRLRFVLRDRDAEFTTVFDRVFASAGLRVIITPLRADAIAERWVGTVCRECTDRMLIFGERHLGRVLAEYARHYNGRRPHRGRQLRPPRPDHPVADFSRARVKRRRVLGGLISEYERAA